MKIETQPIEGHQAKMTVEIEPASFEEAKRRAARKVAQKTKIPGFRPGKAPYQVIVRQVGEAAIIEEALDILVQDIYPKALDETGIKPYGPGSLENVTQMDPPILEFKVPLEPEITLSDYHSIRFPYEPSQVSDQDVDQMIDSFRTTQAVVEPVDRAAQEGDIVYLKISARRTETGEDDAPETLVEERTNPILIKKEADQHEWPYPGFSRELIGLKTGDERTTKHTFDSDADFASLRDVEAEFKYTVEDVKSRNLPELDDEFARSVGEYENLAELQSAIRSSLERQKQNEYDQEFGDKILDELISNSEIKYPSQMLENEIDRIIHNLEHRLEEQGMDMSLYLKSRNLDMQGLREEARPSAEKNLKHSLVLMKVAEAENLEVTSEELQQETIRTYSSLSQSLPEKEARRLNDERVFKNLMNSVLNDMMVEKSLERLRHIASGQVEAEEKAAAERAAESVSANAAAEESQVEPQSEPETDSEQPRIAEGEPQVADQAGMESAVEELPGPEATAGSAGTSDNE